MAHTVPQEEIINVLSVFNESFWAEDRPSWYTEMLRQDVWLTFTNAQQDYAAATVSSGVTLGKVR